VSASASTAPPAMVTPPAPPSSHEAPGAIVLHGVEHIIMAGHLTRAAQEHLRNALSDLHPKQREHAAKMAVVYVGTALEKLELTQAHPGLRRRYAEAASALEAIVSAAAGVTAQLGARESADVIDIAAARSRRAATGGAR
jgi:hypothetical protein